MNKLSLSLDSLQVQSFQTGYGLQLESSNDCDGDDGPTTGYSCYCRGTGAAIGGIHAHGCKTGYRCSKVNLVPTFDDNTCECRTNNS